MKIVYLLLRHATDIQHTLRLYTQNASIPVALIVVYSDGRKAAVPHAPDSQTFLLVALRQQHTQHELISKSGLS